MAKEIAGTHFLGEIGQKIILEKDGKVLMCRGIGSNSWDIPGGRLNKNEDPKAGLMRELKEELGIEVVVKNPFYVCAVHDFKNQPPRYFVVFKGSMINPSDNLVVAQDELDEIRWVSEDEVDTLVTMEDWKKAVNLYFLQRK
jgi:ADP-ribose pyrophosphatase YjhB (NUDIX family)